MNEYGFPPNIILNLVGKYYTPLPYPSAPLPDGTLYTPAAGPW